jgi:hypothetical protein
MTFMKLLMVDGCLGLAGGCCAMTMDNVNAVQCLGKTCEALAAGAHATHVRSSRLLNMLAEALVTAPCEKMLDWTASAT